MNWLSNLFYPTSNNQNYNLGIPPVTNEQIILQNHQYNMNLINASHQNKMNSIQKKYEEEKNLCEANCQANLSKLNLDNNNQYYYYQKDPSLYPNSNTNYDLKIGNVIGLLKIIY